MRIEKSAEREKLRALMKKEKAMIFRVGKKRIIFFRDSTWEIGPKETLDAQPMK